MDIREIQENAKKLCKQNGWSSDHFDERLMYLKEEYLEVLEEIKNMLNPLNTEVGETKINLGYEIYDVVWNLAEIANRFEIDLSKSFEEKQNINTERVYEV